LCLPRRLVPHAVLIADDDDRNDHAIAAELVARRDSVVKFSTRLHGKLQRARQLVVPEKFELILARIRSECVDVFRHGIVTRVAAFDVREIAFHARPLSFLRESILDVVSGVVRPPLHNSICRFPCRPKISCRLLCPDRTSADRTCRHRRVPRTKCENREASNRKRPRASGKHSRSGGSNHGPRSRQTFALPLDPPRLSAL